MELKNPKEITVKDGKGNDHKFYVSDMLAWDGLEIMMRAPTSLISGSIPALGGDWDVVREIQSKILKYVAVDLNGKLQPLVTPALIENHCADWQVLATLLLEEVQHNNSFLRNGTISTFFADTARQYLLKVLEILTQYSAQSSAKNSQPLSSSEQSTQ